jgi:serine/threonine protein kinase
VKEIPMTDGQHADEIQREIAVLAAPSDAEDSKYIIRFLGAFVPRGSNVVCVAMELMDGSLADLVAMKGSLPSLVVAGMVVSILRGLRYLHDSKHVLHRDLKPSNVLFRKRTGEVKIADFGVSADARKGDAESAFVGTLTYMSPERLRGEAYDNRADVWSLGVLTWELLLGEHPFAFAKRKETTEERFWVLLHHLDQIKGCAFSSDGLEPLDDVTKHIVFSALQTDPMKRPGAAELLAHVQDDAIVMNAFLSWLAALT